MQQLAPDALWTHCATSGHTSHAGTTLDATANALEVGGQPTLVNWPYSTTPGHSAADPPPSATTAVWYLAKMVNVPVANDGIEEAIEDVLGTGNCVVLIIEVTDEFDKASPLGTITIPPIDAPEGAYHAVLAVGAATHEGSRCLLVRNTWGVGWGAGGFGWLPLDYLIGFGLEGAAVDPATHVTSPPPNP